MYPSAALAADLDCADTSAANLSPVPFAEPRGIARRTCRECGQAKGLAEMVRDRRTPTGYGSICKACKRDENSARRADPTVRAAEAEYSRDYHAKNRDRIAAHGAEHRQRPEVKAAIAERQAAYRDSNRARPLDLGDGHLSKQCPDCGEFKIRGDFNRLRSRADQRHPHCRDCQARRKERKRTALVAALADEQGGQCFVCQRTFSDDLPFEIDHITARSNGGSDEPDNRALACWECNRGAGGKHDADPWDYLPGALAAVGVDFHAAIRALMTFGEVVETLDEDDEAA